MYIGQLGVSLSARKVSPKETNQAELPLTSTAPQKVIRLKLTPEQAEQLTPLAIDAASSRQNVLFIATVVPFWSPGEEATVWELQTTVMPAKIGHKVKKLISQHT
jgi:hypothetical protein